MFYSGLGDITNYLSLKYGIFRIRTILSGMVITILWDQDKKLGSRVAQKHDPLMEFESIPSLKKQTQWQSIERRKLVFARRDSDMGCSWLFHVAPTV